MSLFSPHDDNIPPLELHGIQTCICSDGVKEIDIRQFYRGQTPRIYASWAEILPELMEKYRGKKPLVAIYPMGAIQIGNMKEK